jgi:hypothetical protein
MVGLKDPHNGTLRPVAEMVLTGKWGQTLFQNNGWFSKETLISLKTRQSPFSLVLRGNISLALFGSSNNLDT